MDGGAGNRSPFAYGAVGGHKARTYEGYKERGTYDT